MIPPHAPAPGKALVIAAFGARGTGKTVWVRRQIEARNAPRLVVWDFKHDPGLEGIGQPVRDLPTLIRAMQAPRFKLRFLVDHSPGADLQKQFDLVCKAVWLAGNLDFFVDELPEVTTASYAPRAWRRLVNIGRDYKDDQGRRKCLTLIAAGQRPAECDKSFISNADILHVGRLGNLPDAKDMAKRLLCDPGELLNLPDLHWIEKSVERRELARGVLTFGNARQAPKKNISVRRPAKKRSL